MGQYEEMRFVECEIRGDPKNVISDIPLRTLDVFIVIKVAVVAYLVS